MRRALPALGLTLLGAGAGVSSVLLHNASWLLWLLAVAAPAATALAAPAGWPRSGFALAWAGVLVVAVLERPEGDFLVAATARGYGLLLAGLALPVLAVATIPRRAP